MRQTKIRKQLASILKKSSDILSADMLYEHVKDEGVNLSTIYRTLEVFMQEDLVSKSVIDYTAFYYWIKRKHHHFMICTECKKRIKIDCYIDAFAQSQAKEHNFKISYHDMTIFGVCKDCLKKEVANQE